MSEWQPIESAPKDGTVVFLGWESKEGEIIHPEERGLWNFVIDEWCHDGELEDYYVMFHPTHWMPLPEPPTKEDNEQDK